MCLCLAFIQALLRLELQVYSAKSLTPQSRSTIQVNPKLLKSSQPHPVQIRLRSMQLVNQGQELEMA